MAKTHSFHIPVMGIGYTIDTPLKISHYGMDSVISLLDDILLEKLRKMYCEKFEIPYKEITDKIEDFRAKRITSYLNLIKEQAEKKFEDFKSSNSEKIDELKDFFNMLPNGSHLKQEFQKFSDKYFSRTDLKKWLNENLSMGSVDVNIMTKVDKNNHKNGQQLATEYNDAHAAVRGFAQSDLTSSIVLSAGMNPRLFSYMEQFEDFYPNENGEIKKKIILKVSDYKSALIQGKFLAKKGLWISEYRIESGLNCGGHAFATEGFLMGPILHEFKSRREELSASVYEILLRTLTSKNRTIPEKDLRIKITAQGGVGTPEEHQFLIDHYEVDSVGWGSPFLLVPEATTVDKSTLIKLAAAKEKDLYLSDISPLGIPFNNLRGNTQDILKIERTEKGKPGSSCPKEIAALNKEFTDKSLCIASRRYQNLKIKELKSMNLDAAEYQEKYDQIVEKSCTCVGLGTSALLAYGLDTKVEGEGVSICPGPNMAYFDKEMSLKEMTDHIYGRKQLAMDGNRPNMFIKELSIYIDFLKNKIADTRSNMTTNQEKSIANFHKNLEEGISYYENLFSGMKDKFQNSKSKLLKDLEGHRKTFQGIVWKKAN